MDEGELARDPVPGEALTVRPLCFSTTRTIDWNTPDLACRASGSQKGQAALIGAGMGALFGGAMGFISGDDTDGWFRFSASEKAAEMAILLAPAGAIVGAIAGQRASWEPLGILNSERRISAVVDGRGVGVRIVF